jgi:hypothetical protein
VFEQGRGVKEYPEMGVPGDVESMGGIFQAGVYLDPDGEVVEGQSRLPFGTNSAA